MAVRATQETMAAVIELDTTITVTPFIAIANKLVDECCLDADYTDEKLQEIETWLAVHFYCVRDPRTTSEGAGGVSASYQGVTGMYLEASTYGQAAMLLDTDGGLAALNQQARKGRSPVIGATWLGTDLDET